MQKRRATRSRAVLILRFRIARLEIEASAELDDARGVVDLRDTPEVIAINVQSCLRIRAGRAEERYLIVQHVESFNSKLQPAVFTESNVLREAGIPVEIRHTIQSVSRHVAGRACRVKEEHLSGEWRLAE